MDRSSGNLRLFGFLNQRYVALTPAIPDEAVRERLGWWGIMAFGIAALVIMFAAVVVLWDVIGQPTKFRHWRRLFRGRRR
jgi:hypothetical protein